MSYPYHSINDVKIIDFPVIEEHEGKLVAIESFKDVPFEIKRTFHIYHSFPGCTRGLHAHKEANQLFICLNNAIRVHCDDGNQKVEHLLDTPGRGILIPSGIWSKQVYWSYEAVALVLTDTEYDPDDYIRYYEEWRLWRIALSQEVSGI